MRVEDKVNTRYNWSLWRRWVVANALAEMLGLGTTFAIGVAIFALLGEPQGPLAALGMILLMTSTGAVEGGAVGYLLKTTASVSLMPMLRGVMQGEAAISTTMAGRILHEFGRLANRVPQNSQDEERPGLTPREKEVLELVAEGATDREIAGQLWITLSTVKTHMRNILAKLHARSRHEAADYAMKTGLIRRPPSDSSRET